MAHNVPHIIWRDGASRPMVDPMPGSVLPWQMGAYIGPSGQWWCQPERPLQSLRGSSCAMSCGCPDSSPQLMSQAPPAPHPPQAPGAARAPHVPSALPAVPHRGTLWHPRSSPMGGHPVAGSSGACNWGRSTPARSRTSIAAWSCELVALGRTPPGPRGPLHRRPRSLPTTFIGCWPAHPKAAMPP